MKISKEDKVIVAVLLFLVLLIGTSIVSSIMYFSEKRSRIASESFNEILVGEVKKRISDQKEYYRISSLKHLAKANNKIRIASVINKQWAVKNNYYINKIKQVEKVNIYSSRQRYADSLARTMQ